MPTKERWARLTPEQRSVEVEKARLARGRKRQDPEWAERERQRERERYLRRKQTEPEKIREWNRKASAKQYATNGDKRREQRRDYRRRNREQEQERDRVYHATDEYREKAREYAKAYRKRRPELARAYSWKQRGSDSSSEARQWALVLLGDPCCYCGMATEEIDHIDAIINGGNGEWSNLTASCLTCNRSKGSRPLLLWLATAIAA